MVIVCRLPLPPAVRIIPWAVVYWIFASYNTLRCLLHGHSNLLVEEVIAILASQPPSQPCCSLSTRWKPWSNWVTLSTRNVSWMPLKGNPRGRLPTLWMTMHSWATVSVQWQWATSGAESAHNDVNDVVCVSSLLDHLSFRELGRLWWMMWIQYGVVRRK